MSRLRIFVTQPIAESALARLRPLADVEVNADSSKLISKADLCAGVARCDVLLSLLHDRIDKDVIAANPNLRAINSMVITPDHIDVAEATRRKIPVTNIPAIVTDATADLCFGLLLAVARRIVEGDKLFRGGGYPGSQSNHLAGAAVAGKTLGIVGAGRIGQAMARRAGGFGMTVIYADPRRVPEEQERRLGMTYRPLDDVLREADFITLHPQLGPDTRHLIGAREFGLMKPSAFILNTSRGPVIEEAALVEALQTKKIAGAGLDVYENEPSVAPALLTMPNVVLTPHLGSAVYELREGMAHVVVDNVIAVIEGRRPPNCINPEIYA
ncbi:MAG: D-3-phosphoglycerate dehydrogenase [Pseudolabrys sp.]|jgi:glyoxylate reductase|nr:D-3-phosphoglycerate dehydrogenase [Pseudolabrys sp.]